MSEENIPMNEEADVTEETLVLERERDEIKIEHKERDELIYGVNDTPPWSVTITCGLQYALISMCVQLIISSFVAEAVCASKNDAIKARLLSSTLFMNGITTITMNTIGVRLPLFQGAASEYAVPLMVLSSISRSYCSVGQDPYASFGNLSSNASEVEEMVTERIVRNITALQGSLMLAGVVHVLLGFTGLVGLLLRFIGPITIVPTLTLTALFLVEPALHYVESSWPIALS